MRVLGNVPVHTPIGVHELVYIGCTNRICTLTTGDILVTCIESTAKRYMSSSLSLYLAWNGRSPPKTRSERVFKWYTVVCPATCANTSLAYACLFHVRLLKWKIYTLSLHVTQTSPTNTGEHHNKTAEERKNRSVTATVCEHACKRVYAFLSVCTDVLNRLRQTPNTTFKRVGSFTDSVH